MSKEKIEITANDFVNVKDIKDIFLYTRDDYIFCFLRIFPFNIDLLSEEERQILAHHIAASFDGDRADWVYQTFPREVDLDHYKDFLNASRQRIVEEQLIRMKDDSIGRKRIIDDQIVRAAELSMNGENFEHQHFFKIWKKIEQGSNKAQTEAELRDRIQSFRIRYESVQIKCEILKEKEIIKLCNLFGNGQLAGYEGSRSLVQPEIPKLG